jgi:hypothetical protein
MSLPLRNDEYDDAITLVYSASVLVDIHVSHSRTAGHARAAPVAPRTVA